MRKYLKIVSGRIKKDLSESWRGIVAAVSALILFTILFKTICPLRLITGYPCPGCGITRAAFSVLRLDFAGAVSLNPSVFLWAGLSAYIVISRYFIGKSKKFDLALIMVSLFTIAIYIYRMAVLFPSGEPLSYYPENLLAFKRTSLSKN